MPSQQGNHAKNTFLLQYDPCVTHRLAFKGDFSFFCPRRRDARHVCLTFCNKKVARIELRRLSSREIVLKITFALQYDPCATHCLASRGDFSRFCRLCSTRFSILAIIKLSALRPTRLKSRGNASKFDFSLQYTPCKMHRLAGIVSFLWQMSKMSSFWPFSQN